MKAIVVNGLNDRISTSGCTASKMTVTAAAEISHSHSDFGRAHKNIPNTVCVISMYRQLSKDLIPKSSFIASLHIACLDKL